LRAVKGAAAGCGTRLGFGTTGLFLRIVATGGLIEQCLDFAGFHALLQRYGVHLARRVPPLVHCFILIKNKKGLSLSQQSLLLHDNDGVTG
jgi:hypothetical protein